MRNYKTEGIVLKRTNFSESDKIFTILTKDFGKLHLIAKGIRKTTSRKAPNLEPFLHSKLYIVKGRNLDIISEVEKIRNFPEIRKNLKKVAFAYQICEMIDKLLPEQQVNRSLFNLLVAEMIVLNDLPKESEYQLNRFIMKLLWDLGYLPKDKVIPENNLDAFVSEVIERDLKSKQLLTMINKKFITNNR